MPEHHASLITDEDRPHEWEVWCSCTRYGAVGVIRKSWYSYGASIRDDDTLSWFTSRAQALQHILAAHPGACA